MRPQGFSFVGLSVALLSGASLSAPNPTPTPDVASRIRAYRAAHPGVFRVGGDVTEPREISRVKPEYPEGSLTQAVTLRPVLLLAVITETGAVLDPVLVNSVHPDLDAAVLKAVRQWRYEPARLDGKAVPAFLNIWWRF
jgi:TonB family protein